MRIVKKLTPDILEQLIAEESEKLKQGIVTEDVITHADETREDAWAGGDNLVDKVDYHLDALNKLQIVKLKEVKKILELKQRLSSFKKGNK